MTTSSCSGSGGVAAAASAGALAGFKVYGSLFKVDARYQFLNALGKGSYGIVCAAKDKETGQCVAIKKVSPMAKRTVDAKHALREVLLLQYLGKHPNIVSVHNLSTNVKDDELYIVMDLMDTDLHRVIQSSQPLSEAHVKFFLHQLLRGVKYLHDNGVLHRDLKPGNLLLTKTCQLKIADFGLARKLPKTYSSTPSSGSNITGLERPRSAPAAASSSSSSSRIERAPMTEHVVTRWYRAPELMLQPDGLYDRGVDMWSVGCIFAEVLGRKALFPGKNFMHQLSLIFDVIGTPPTEATARIKSAQAQKFLRSLGKRPKVPLCSLFPNASESALDLLERLLEFDPVRRITADDALAHPYLVDVEKKYKGGSDPHPSLRIDFSFDSKNLTKMDLRAIIIKEVDRVRKVQAGGKGDDVGIEEPTEPPGHGDGVHQVARALCGAAGSSLIRATARPSVPLPPPREHEDGQQPAMSTQQHPPAQNPSVVVLGSRRHRIRTLSKPPVPRRPSTGGTAGPSGVSQGNIRVASVAATQQLLAQDAGGREEIDVCVDESAGGGAAAGHLRVNGLKRDAAPSPTECEHSPAGPESTDSDRSREEHKEAPRSSVSRATAIPSTGMMPSISTTPATTAPTYSIFTTVERTTGRPSSASRPRELDPNSTTRAIAAAMALAERSKALIASLSTSTTAESTAQRTDTSKREESPAADPSSPTPESPSLSSSSSSGPGSPPSSCDQVSSSRSFAQPTAPPIARRRVASAGPVRARPSRGNTSAATDGTFVGSTSSLIRAQRAGGGQTLTESANRAIAAMTTAPPCPLTMQLHEHEEDDRAEKASPPKCAPTLKPQRSTSQLHNGNDHQHAGGKKAAAKRLTVPRSPKFSVMSWQKKRDGGGYVSGVGAAGNHAVPAVAAPGRQ